MTWHDYLRYERGEKMREIEMLSSGRVRSFITTDGVQRETTQENVEKLKSDIAEIEQILRDAGEPVDA